MMTRYFRGNMLTTHQEKFERQVENAAKQTPDMVIKAYVFDLEGIAILTKVAQL